MKYLSDRSSVPVEVHFDGYHQDESLVDLCLEAARCLELGAKRPGSCVVEVTRRARLAEIRINFETSGEKIAISRVCPAADEPQLRASLADVFAQMTRRVEEAPHLYAPRGTQPRKNPASDCAPPCIWQG